MSELKSIQKVLVANRGEIAIRILRACTELNIRTVAIYSREDLPSLHRYKADESYLIGEDKKPIDAYLAIEEIIALAKEINVDAIHPGYGFLSENIHFARRCEEEGIIFIGPTSDHLEMFGDKVNARSRALDAGLPVIPGTDGPVTSVAEVETFADTYGFPLIIKASLGGGGRGMRIITHREELPDAFERARSEALSVFGNDEIYVEKYIEDPKHIEVQVMGDVHGNIVHLHERDCSIQRRHQKVVEAAPSLSLSDELKEAIFASALDLAESVGYVNAGTIEFLVTGDEYYFIEVNPRVQVEHTITEMITGVDIVQSQLKIAEGRSLHEETVDIPAQEDIRTNGYAIQSRVTTEDPLNDFMPDTGRIMVYRSSGGFGVRLDAGDGFQGAVVSPHYDSLLVKVSTWAPTFEQAAQKMGRNLKEFRIRGIKTNIPFLINVITHKRFLSGEYDTNFIDETPELFIFPVRKDRGTKLLTYIADMTVNGVKGVEKKEKPDFSPLHIPRTDRTEPIPAGTKQLLEAHGPDHVAAWMKEQENVLLTDTTFRDAHQSLLATRVRTKDLERIAEPMARLLPNLFSAEVWGGATFDVAYRFLREDPWQRLLSLREKMPNTLFQMLLRASNGVGYKNYPDNLIDRFVQESARAGIDVFRIFDSLNWLESMVPSIEAVRENGKLAEASICYTGNLLAKNEKYDLAYYKSMARELESAGAHILGIKDMAGLLKPEAAYQLITELKETVDIPIHLHTHDTSGNGIYAYARAIDAGVDAVDVATGSLAGSTSQPSAQTLYHALDGHSRQPDIDVEQYEELSKYWDGVRDYYQDFENGMLSPHTEVYFHEMPGGQYSNLWQQAKAVGLGERWEEVKVMFHHVNDMFGDIVKVTPSSKIVGDMALFMVQNDLTEKDIYERGENIDFPASVVEFFQGYIGQPYGGFPERLQEVVLKGGEAVTGRPGALLEPVDFKQLEKDLYHKLDREITIFDIIAYALYPDVFMSYHHFTNTYADVSVLDTPTYFYGMQLGEEIEVEIEQGKTLYIRLLSISEPRADATRVIYFELNGQSREIIIKDMNVPTDVLEVPKADANDSKHIGATMPGTVIDVLCARGDEVEKGDQLLVTEAMKMETTVQAPFKGVIKAVYVDADTPIAVNDLLVEFE